MQLTKALATAWAKDNIQVNAILPGLDRHRPHPAGAQRRPRPARARAGAHAGRRWGVPDDFAGIAVFLASPASDFVTGAAIPIDGGYSIQS